MDKSDIIENRSNRRIFMKELFVLLLLAMSTVSQASTSDVFDPEACWRWWEGNTQVYFDIRIDPSDLNPSENKALVDRIFSNDQFRAVSISKMNGATIDQYILIKAIPIGQPDATNALDQELIDLSSSQGVTGLDCGVPPGIPLPSASANN
jgi:hypothetical protein